MPTPTFSIVIPTYGRPQQLAEALTALASLDWPAHDAEVIIVDDGSPVGHQPQPPTAPFPFPLRLLRQPNRGPAAARNRGAQEACGRYLAFTDDDCRPRPNWLRALAKAFNSLSSTDNDDTTVMLGGRTVNGLPNNLCSSASELLLAFLYTRHQHQLTFFASNNIAMATAHFRQLGGFSADYPLAAAEDREFCRRWQTVGYSLQLAEEAVVEHHHALSLFGYCRQHFNYGRGAALYHDTQLRRTRHTVLPDRLGFYRGLLSYPLRTERGLYAWTMAFLMGVSQVAVTSGFAWEEIKIHRRKAKSAAAKAANRGGPRSIDGRSS